MKTQSEFEKKMEYLKCISKINNIGRQKHKKAYRAKNERKKRKIGIRETCIELFRGIELTANRLLTAN